MVKRIITYLYYKLNCYVGDTENDHAMKIMAVAIPKGVDVLFFKNTILRQINAGKRMFTYEWEYFGEGSSGDKTKKPYFKGAFSELPDTVESKNDKS